MTGAAQVSSITGFSPKSESWFEIDGVDYSTQNGNEPYSLALNDDTFRFEVRPDDFWKKGSTTSERSEICGEKIYAPDEVLNVSYSFMIEPGAANTATGRGGEGDWLILGQFHGSDLDSQPAFAIEMLREKMAIVVRYGDPVDSKYLELFVDSQPIERGHYYDMDIDVRFENNGNGFLNVWRDGTQIVSYSGPLGYDNGVFWKYGVYRSEADSNIAVNYRDMSVGKGGDGTDGGVTIVGSRAADTIDPDTSPDGQPLVTDHSDLIRGAGGSDLAKAGDGDDILIMGRGNDRLFGGFGDDILNGGKGNDRLAGDIGDDVLKGGKGGDTFTFAPGFGADVIRDFDVARDRIEFDGGIFADFAAVMSAASEQDGGVMITTGEDSLFLAGVRLERLDAGDILFA